MPIWSNHHQKNAIVVKPRKAKPDKAPNTITYEGDSVLWRGQSKTRIAIGFCLIRQSSVSPIVCVHQSNQLSRAYSIGMPRRFWVVPWINERRSWELSPLFLLGDVGIESRMARLVLNCDRVDLITHELIGDVVTIGSAPLNHVVIDNPAVSAQHAIVARVADSYRLRDLNSTNGTQVNDISVTDAELKDGDKIQFGSVVAVFARDDRKTSSSCRFRWTRISS
jgi:hypothetical protein